MSMNKGSEAPELKKGSGADLCYKKLWKRLRQGFGAPQPWSHCLEPQKKGSGSAL